MFPLSATFVTELKKNYVNNYGESFEAVSYCWYRVTSFTISTTASNPIAARYGASRVLLMMM